MQQGTDLAAQLRALCVRENWYGPWDFKPKAGQAHANTTGFAFARAAETQLQRTEEILGFPLPPILRYLYTELANGGFGPGGGMRGVVGGYGTVGTALPNEQTFLNDETVVKYHTRGQGQTFVDLDRYANQWEQTGQTREILLPCDVWPMQLFPICDLGCVQEVCLDQKGHVFLWASSEAGDFVYALSDLGISFDEWLRQRLEEETPSHSIR
jgi:SMI1 / KNR4 family (SUKH-1)